MSSNPSPRDEHRAAAPQAIRCAVLTISDTRTSQTDRGGPIVVDLLTKHGHQVVFRQIVPDDSTEIERQVRDLASSPGVDAVLLTGGTGISPRDQTYETISALLDTTIPGFGELFRWLSFQEIGPAALLSRTTGGLMNRTVILTMPGSPAAVHLAMERLVLPELGHLVQQAGKSG